MKILNRKIFNYFGCFMIKKDYIIENDLKFDETVFFGVDQAYMWRLMVNVPSYTFNEKQVYNYFERPGSIMTGTKIKKMLTGLPSMEKCAKDLMNNPYFDSFLIVERWKMSVLHTVAQTNNYEDFLSAYEDFKPNIKKCFIYPDIRVKLVGLCMLFGKRITYAVLRRN